MPDADAEHRFPVKFVCRAGLSSEDSLFSIEIPWEQRGRPLFDLIPAEMFQIGRELQAAWLAALKRRLDEATRESCERSPLPEEGERKETPMFDDKTARESLTSRCIFEDMFVGRDCLKRDCFWDYFKGPSFLKSPGYKESPESYENYLSLAIGFYGSRAELVCRSLTECFFPYSGNGDVERTPRSHNHPLSRQIQT